MPEKATKEGEIGVVKNILLWGPTVSGKSALANVLTDTHKLFDEGRCGGWDITSKVQVGEFVSDLTDAEGQTITYQIIDLPGTDNTELTLTELFAEIKNEVETSQAEE